MKCRGFTTVQNGSAECHSAECHSAECHSAERRDTFCKGLKEYFEKLDIVSDISEKSHEKKI